ncbi:hypothetical protein ACG33_07430 [Steroidobacter denitrificans]|uniref:Uncharacterized protein n=1 Tax=Steroidobacter denitrificans TaxID=465721 RepID=A0A127FBK4_STEDE|nr:hypothetical protein ACG33_07430 [Steroidobacter denitrificans]
MIVVGDAVIAAGGRFEFVSFSDAFASKPLCVNIEGAVARSGFESPWNLHNASEWIKLLSGFTQGPVFAGQQSRPRRPGRSRHDTKFPRRAGYRIPVLSRQRCESG